MSLTEPTRVRLYQYFEEQMGADLAAEIMEWLPRGDFATKDDIEALRLATKADIEQLRVETKAEFRSVRADIEALGETTKAEFAHQQETVGMRVEILAHQVRGEFHKVVRQHTVVLFGAMVALASAARIF